MAINVSSVNNVPVAPGKNEARGKTIGTVAGLGAGYAYERQDIFKHMDWITEDAVKKGNGGKARAFATACALGIIAAVGAIGRAIGGVAGKAIDNKK